MPVEILLRIYILVLAFICGACAASFITCAADRYIAKEPIWRGRSHCPACGHTLGVRDLFPILSYLFLRGRCRHCGARIPVRCLFTEVLGGILYLSAALRFGLSFETLEYCLLFSFLLAVALIDYDSMEIPDALIACGLVVFGAFLWAHPDPYTRAVEGMIGALCIGGGLLLLSLLMDFILKKESLGGGDVKLFLLLGFVFGPWQGLLLVLLACVAGLVFLIPRDPKKEFPFGPAIALAAWITALIGDTVITAITALIL